VNYTLDLNTGLTQVLNDGTNQYLYGVGRIAQVNTTTLITDYFITDALGSVRQLTNGQGEVTLVNAYEPFGSVSQSAGSAQTSYGFTGEFTDASGLVNLRARYYSPQTGRFFTPDPFGGNVVYPASLNPYTYGYDNPVLYTDPSGECVDPLSFAICLSILLAATAGGADLYYQLHQNNGNLDCVDWGEVAMFAGGAGVAGLIVGLSVPVILVSPDSALDIASLAYDAYTGDAASFALDAISLMLPGVTGLGALSHADEAYDTLRYADEVSLGMTRYQQDILIRNLDPDALIAVRPRKWGAFAWDGFFPAKGQIHNTEKIWDSANLDSGLRINLDNGRIVVSDLDIAGYTIKGMPVPENQFMATFAQKFNKDYGYEIITHGHFAEGVDTPSVVNVLNSLPGNKLQEMLEESIYLFDATGYRGAMKFWEYYSSFVTKVR
jgi:RHS repeat-associated protein